MGEDYKGGRTFDDLKKFATENLGPSCGPDNLDLCDDAKKALIAKYNAMVPAQLDKLIKDSEEEAEKQETGFKQYEDASKKKDDAVAAIKDSGLGFAKAVKASKK